jgi:hypothetical protein
VWVSGDVHVIWSTIFYAHLSILPFLSRSLFIHLSVVHSIVTYFSQSLSICLFAHTIGAFSLQPSLSLSLLFSPIIPLTKVIRLCFYAPMMDAKFNRVTHSHSHCECYTNHGSHDQLTSTLTHHDYRSIRFSMITLYTAINVTH